MVYYLTLFIDTTSLEVDYPIIAIFSKILRYSVYILFFIRFLFILSEYKKNIFQEKWKEKSIIIKGIYIVSIIIFISLIINCITTRNKRMIFLILILLSSYKTDYKKIIKTTMILQIVLTSIVVVLCVLGATQNYIVLRESVQRSSLGFTYTTNLAQMILFSSILYLYNTGTKVDWKELFVIQLLNSFTYFITDSRSEFIILQCIVISMVGMKLIEKTNYGKIVENVKRIYAAIFSHTFYVYPFLSFIIVICYEFGGVWKKLNVILSNRLKQTYENIMLYGINPFGKEIEFIGFGLKQKLKYGEYASNYIDNEYIQMMFNEGVIFIIAFILLLNLLLIMLYEKKKYKEVILCSIYLIFGLINPRIVNILYCPILFMLIPTILEYKNNSKKKERVDEKQINSI